MPNKLQVSNERLDAQKAPKEVFNRRVYFVGTVAAFGGILFGYVFWDLLQTILPVFDANSFGNDKI